MSELKPTIIVTGSNGFIGRAIIKSLSPQFNIVGFDKSVSNENGNLNLEVDISSAESVKIAFDLVREKYGKMIASVIHLAAYYSFAEEQSPLYEKITVQGTHNLLEQLKNFQVEQFIFSSTMLVHQSLDVGEKITEKTSLNPSWAYPQSKVAAEAILKKERGDISLVNLRIAGVYDDHCHSIPIANQIMRIYELQLSSHLYPGDKNKGQSFLHLEDLVSAIFKLVLKRNDLPKETTLLLGEPKALSYQTMQKEIGKLVHNKEWDALKVPAWFAKMGSWLLHHTPLMRKPFIMPWMIDFTSDHYEMDISLAKKLINWSPRHKLEATLPIMIRHLKENPRQWYKENKLEEPGSWSRLLGRMPDEESGYKTLELSYHHQLNTLNLMNMLWGIWYIADSFSHGIGGLFLYSAVISGMAIVILSALALWLMWQWPRWIAAIIGLWILFSPLAFWTTSASAYSMANLLGFLIIFCAAFQPAKTSLPADNLSDRPRGWSYNPSSWPQRIPIVLLALAGFFIARYMAAYQLGYIDSVWDPVFGRQTENILKSDVSRAFPVSDAGLGAISYLLDAVTGLIGNRRRYKTMPWMVLVFGFMIIPAGITSIALVILQPVAVNAWCFLCLVTAVIMLFMVSPAIDEVIATIQFLRQSYKEGKPFWRTLLRGEENISSQDILPAYSDSKVAPTVKDIPWSLTGSLLLSSTFMFLPAFMDIAKPASSYIYFSAALMLTFAVIALSEIARPVRLLNVVLALLLAVAVFLLDGISIEARMVVFSNCLLIALLSLPKGHFNKHFGNFDRLARWSPVKRSSFHESNERG